MSGYLVDITGAGVTSDGADLSSYITRSEATTAFVDVAGDSMNANLDMTNHKIINLADPTSNKDAINKDYVDNNFVSQTNTTYVKKVGDSMTGILSMGNNKITNLANPTVGTDVVNMNYAQSSFLGKYDPIDAFYIQSNTLNKDRLPADFNSFGLNDNKIILGITRK